MKLESAIMARRPIKRQLWNDEIIDIHLRPEKDRYKFVIEHLTSSEEHDYRFDEEDFNANDWEFYDAKSR